MKLSIILGIILGTMMFPMIMIPLMGIGIITYGLYYLIHDIIFSKLIKN